VIVGFPCQADSSVLFPFVAPALRRTLLFAHAFSTLNQFSFVAPALRRTLLVAPATSTLNHPGFSSTLNCDWTVLFLNLLGLSRLPVSSNSVESS
jgi:hypothetical protein